MQILVRNQQVPDLVLSPYFIFALFLLRPDLPEELSDLEDAILGTKEEFWEQSDDGITKDEINLTHLSIGIK